MLDFTSKHFLHITNGLENDRIKKCENDRIKKKSENDRIKKNVKMIELIKM